MGMNILGYTSKCDPSQKKQFITHWKFHQARRPKVLLILNPVFVSWDYMFFVETLYTDCCFFRPTQQDAAARRDAFNICRAERTLQFPCKPRGTGAVLGPKKRPDLPTVQSPDFVRARWVAFIYLFIYLSIYRSVCLSIHPSIHLHIHKNNIYIYIHTCMHTYIL